MHLAIHTEFLHNSRSGLGHFTLSAIAALRDARPDWRITVVANSGFRELKALESDKLRILCWDNQPLLRIALALTEWIPGTHPDGLRYLFSRLWGYLPSSRMREAGGDLTSIWGNLRPDVVWAPYHSVGQPHVGLFQNLSATRAPVVTTVHDLHQFHFPYEWSDGELEDFQKNFCGLIRESECVITQTEFQRQDIVARLGIAREKVLLQPYPPLIQASKLNSGLSPSQRRDKLTELGVEGPFLFYPSSQTKAHKNHARLFLAWRKLKERLQGRCPLLVGTVTSPHHASLRALLEALDLQDCVRFVGGVDDQTLFALYEECEGVVVPSLYEGGGAGPLTEAILFNRPVLGSDIAPFREQMALYGVDSVRWFSPTDVDDIADKLTEFFESPRVDQSQTSAAAVLSSCAGQWGSWAEFYARQLEAAVKSEHGIVSR